MKRLIFCASALTAMLAMSSACNDDNELQDISKSDATATTLQLTPEEISVLKTMDGQSPIISQDEAISIAENFLGKKTLSKASSGLKCEVITRQGDGYYLSNVFGSHRKYEIGSSTNRMVSSKPLDGYYYKYNITISNDIYR